MDERWRLSSKPQPMDHKTNSLLMRNPEGRQIGEELKAALARLRAAAMAERAKQGPDREALEIALVNLDSAIEILTE